MALEAIAAIGLASNIVQFVHFGVSLLSKAHEIRHSASGSLKDHVDLKIISNGFQKCSSGLLCRSDSIEFTGLATRCRNVAGELETMLRKIEGTQHIQRWKSFRQAAKAVLGKNHINEVLSRLERLRGELMLRLVLDSRYVILNIPCSPTVLCTILLSLLGINKLRPSNC